MRQWARLGALVEPLSRDQVSHMLGIGRLVRRLLEPDRRNINPLALSWGMARAGLDLGRRIDAALAAISFLSGGTTAGS